MTVDEAYKSLMDQVQRTLDNGINVFIGGSPTVVQVTRGLESRTFRTVPLASSTGKPVIQEISNQPLPAVIGNVCVHCGGPLVRSGTCEVCHACGSTTGCS